jgi:hypothetical protein
MYNFLFVCSFLKSVMSTVGVGSGLGSAPGSSLDEPPGEDEAYAAKRRAYELGLRDLVGALIVFSFILATLFLEGNISQLHAAHESLLDVMDWNVASEAGSFDEASEWLEQSTFKVSRLNLQQRFMTCVRPRLDPTLQLMSPSYDTIIDSCPVEKPAFGQRPVIPRCKDKLGVLYSKTWLCDDEEVRR